MQSFPVIRLLIVVDTLGVHSVTLKNVSLVASSLFRMICGPLEARGRGRSHFFRCAQTGGVHFRDNEIDTQSRSVC